MAADTATQVVAAEGWRVELDKMAPQWEALFSGPAHVARFKRVVATAIAANPDLLAADRRSLWQAATQAAQDELAPDGREGAFVIYNVKVKEKQERGPDKESWRKVVRWMPMVAGLLKKIRKSGELLDISVQAVLAADTFSYQLGDEARIVHVPDIETDDRGELRFVYAIARTKDGGVYREVMSRKQIDQVRAASKTAANGPWKDWYDEMARKSVLRRLSKFLPMGAEVEAILAREDHYSAQAAAITLETVPLLAEPRKNSARARREGDWEVMVEEIQQCRTLGDLDDWWARNEAKIDALPNEHWQVAIRDQYETYAEFLASASEPA